MKRSITSILIIMFISTSAFAQLEVSEGANGKLGFKDMEDNWVIQPQYDDSYSWQSYQYSVFFVKLNGKWGAIDTLGKTVLPFEYQLIYKNKDESSESDYSFRQGKVLIVETGAEMVCKIMKNNRYGLVSLATGKVVIDPVFDDNLTFLEFYDGSTSSYLRYAIGSIKGKWGSIDIQGKTIIPFEYDKIITPTEEYNELIGQAKVIKNKRYGLVNLLTGKVISAPVYDQDFYFEENMWGMTAIVYKNKKAGMLDSKGVEVVSCKYDGGKKPFVDLDYEYFMLARQNGKVGVIDSAGREVVRCQYDEIKISDAMGDVFEITKNKKYGLCGFDGKEIIAPLYDKTFYFEGEYSLVNLKGKYGVINKKGETVVPFTYSKEEDASAEMMKLYDK
jgi:hypothetical protein